MDWIAPSWKKLARAVGGLRVELRLCLRMSLAAVLSYLLSESLHLPLPLWAVLTAVIVTQMSVGKSVKATLDYMEGTVGGAIYSGLIASLFPQASGAAVPVVLVLAIAPLALLAARSPRFAIAPFTAATVLLLPSVTHLTTFQSAFYRVVEVALGCAVSLPVSLIVLPELARNFAIETAARMLALVAGALPQLIACVKGLKDPREIAHLQESIGAAFIRLNATVGEARRERVAYFNAEPDSQQLIDVLLRLRHDLVLIGRAAVEPFPAAFLERLDPAIDEVSESAAEYLDAGSRALSARSPPPPLARFEAAVDSYAAAFAAARRDGLTGNLSTDSAERIFAFGFALEQLRQDFRNLQNCFAQIARSRHDPAMSKA